MPNNQTRIAKPIAVATNAPARATEAARLATDLGLPLVEAGDTSYPLHLRFTEQRLEIVQTGANAPGPVFVDFASPALEFRRRKGGGTKEQLARAVGIKAGHRPLVIDATAGLGRDAFILAALGCRVIMVERQPLIHALLADGLRRAGQDRELGPWLGERLQLHNGDFIELAQRGHLPETPQVVYLDPMFPSRTKQAMVKKEMRLLQELIGQDDDEEQLLAVALKAASQRVTVKRPRLAAAIAGRSPNFAITGRANRFDVYLL